LGGDSNFNTCILGFVMKRQDLSIFIQTCFNQIGRFVVVIIVIILDGLSCHTTHKIKCPSITTTTTWILHVVLVDSVNGGYWAVAYVAITIGMLLLQLLVVLVFVAAK
jgi:hypothetical protein